MAIKLINYSWIHLGGPDRKWHLSQDVEDQQFGALKGHGAPETPPVCANVTFAFAVYAIFFRL